MIEDYEVALIPSLLSLSILNLQPTLCQSDSPSYSGFLIKSKEKKISDLYSLKGYFYLDLIRNPE